MARRSDHSREELAILVIDAAREITAKQGWRDATMRKIAERIGYAPGSIYNAVGDIDEVLLRVNAATLEGLSDRLAAVLERDGGQSDAAKLALVMADEYIAYATAHARLWAALLEHPPASDKAAPEWYLRARNGLFDLVASAIEPLFPDRSARARAVVALWASLQGVASLAIGGNLALAAGEFKPQDIARSIVARYLTGRE